MRVWHSKLQWNCTFCYQTLEQCECLKASNYEVSLRDIKCRRCSQDFIRCNCLNLLGRQNYYLIAENVRLWNKIYQLQMEIAKLTGQQVIRI